MKILFICGCLEPGKDGVGDYVRRMADGCLALGSEVTMLALNDHHVSSLTVQDANGHRVVRAPNQFPAAGRKQCLSDTVTTAKPKVVSLQYSPFAYDHWGIAGGLADFASVLPRSITRHFLLHELWLERRDGGWQAQLRGRFQRIALRRSVRAWQPAIIQTTNDAYQRRLATIGISARKLALPSNVPVCNPGISSWFEEEVDLPGEADTRWLFGIFGTIHPEWDGGSAIQRLIEVAEKNRRAAFFISIGRTNSPPGRWKQWQQRFGERVVRSPLGERPISQISEFLRKIDFGLSTNPLALTGKSTSVAAMLEHGLPVIVFRLEGERGLPSTYRAEQLIPADETLNERMARARKLPPEDRLLAIARDFLDGFC
ncbi:MAG: hypothetical protein JO333_07705 [Verrucomicrobia bacterium]|nr:hypothetical protein [Verrucomicrobiota bacterium]